jgi:hypothetical protein
MTSRIPRFRKFGQYPSGYPTKLADQQSAVPSQYSEVPPAFDPSMHPDMIPTDPIGVVDQSIVRHVFDSRPPFAYDFFFEDTFQGGVDLLGGYTVPVGWNLFLRRIILSIYPVTGEVATRTITIFGDLDVLAFAAPILQILNNGAPASDWTVGQVVLFDVTGADIEIETFVKIKGGNNLNISLSGITSPPNPTLNVYVQYYGNMLLSTGRNIVNEVGNQYPQPVIDVDASKGQPT